jgi:hypothetical protein
VAEAAARCAVEVVAGVIPGQPIEEFTQRWVITSEEWHSDKTDQHTMLAAMNGKAMGWAMWLMFQPDRVNWVKTEWIWF